MNPTFLPAHKPIITVLFNVYAQFQLNISFHFVTDYVIGVWKLF